MGSGDADGARTEPVDDVVDLRAAAPALVRPRGASAGTRPPRSAEAAAREAAALATGLSFSVADARSADLELVWVSPGFTGLTGYAPEEAVGRNCRFLQGPGTDRAAADRLRDALAAGRPAVETPLNHRADGTPFWNQVAVSPVVDDDGAVTHHVAVQTDVSERVAADAERARALAAVEAAHARLHLLTEVTRQLSDLASAEQALHRLTRLVVPALADFAVLATTGAGPGTGHGEGHEDGHGAAAGAHGLRDVAWLHRDPARQGALQTYAASRLASLDEHGRTALGALLGPEPPGRPAAAPAPAGQEAPAAHRDLGELLEPGPALEALRALAPAAVTTLALRSRGRVLGLMTLGSDAGRTLDDDDRELAADAATRAALALDGARLARQQHDLAAGLQRSLLALSSRAAPEHVEVAVRYVAAAEQAAVGGDFYDVVTQPGGSALVVIGDVVGHDSQAAAAMAQLRSVVRTLGAVGDDHPAALLVRTDALMDLTGVDTTATAAVVRLTAPPPPPLGGVAGPGALLEWSSAGHPPPVVIGADGVVRLLEAASADLLLGLDPGTDRQLTTSHLEAGAVLLMYTDGLVERRREPLDAGIARLRRVAADAARSTDGLEELVDAVLAAMLPAHPDDDVAVVAVRLA